MTFAGRRTASALALALTTLLPACGASTSTGPGAEARVAAEKAAVDKRLQGTWRLVDFRTDVPLEPMLALYLQSQKGVLLVRFNNGQLTAESPVISFSKPYKLTEAVGQFFTVTAPSNTGVLYTSRGQLSDDDRRITFRSETEPYRGQGILERVGK